MRAVRPASNLTGRLIVRFKKSKIDRSRESLRIFGGEMTRLGDVASDVRQQRAWLTPCKEKGFVHKCLTVQMCANTCNNDEADETEQTFSGSPDVGPIPRR